MCKECICCSFFLSKNSVNCIFTNTNFCVPLIFRFIINYILIVYFRLDDKKEKRKDISSILLNSN